MFLSDNGLGWGDHRWDFKVAPYEGSIAVPFVARYDRLTRARAGRANEGLLLNVDIVPTLLELAGIAPGDWIDGQSIVPLLRGGPTVWRRSVLIEHLCFDRSPRESVPSYCAIRTRRWKYVVYGNRFKELYNLRKDPFELSNVARSRPSGGQLHRRLRVLCDPPPPGYSALG